MIISAWTNETLNIIFLTQTVLYGFCSNILFNIAKTYLIVNENFDFIINFKLILK